MHLQAAGRRSAARCWPLHAAGCRLGWLAGTRCWSRSTSGAAAMATDGSTSGRGPVAVGGRMGGAGGRTGGGAGGSGSMAAAAAVFLQEETKRRVE
jgi:hypothetical protein